MLIVIALVKMPNTTGAGEKQNSIRQTLSNLWHNKVYREGVFTQVFYVAAQIMTWTFIIQYADNLGINKATAQNYNIVAMILFLCGRFISTFLMKYVNGRKLLAIFGIGAGLCALGAVLIVGMTGLYCLVGIIIDQGTLWGHPAVNVSYVLPLICFVVVTTYGVKSYRRMKATGNRE